MDALQAEYEDYQTIDELVGWPDNSLSVPEHVRRIWDSEARVDGALEDDIPESLITISDYALFQLPDPDEDWDDYRTDDRGEDYRIEEALEGCPFETDNLADGHCGVGYENWTDNYPVDTGFCFTVR